MNVKKKWSLHTIAIVAAGLLVQLLASYAVALWAMRFSVSTWIVPALAGQVSLVDDAMSGALHETAAFVARSPSLETSEPAEIERYMRRRFTGPNDFWAWIPPAPAAPVSSDPRCSDKLLRLREALPDTPSFYFACGGRARLVASAPIEGRGARLLVGDVMDSRYARHVRKVTNAEVLVFLGEEVIGSTLVSVSGGEVRVPVRAGELAPPGASGPSLRERELRLEGYAGYPLGDESERVPVATNGDWYVAAQRGSIEQEITVALLVPRSFMLLGPRYNILIMSGISLVLLACMGLLVWKLVARFSDPIAALSASAQAVGRGDLSRTVPVPADAEMGDFCRTYNSMLGKMSDLVGRQKQLARKAGRSEIATGVLHNVGNVLNSVNVAASLALEVARGSKVENLHKATRMLDEHAADLPAFLADDPRGKKLPGYLGKLSVHLLAERDRMVTELGELLRSVEHIKTIVAMQQSYAKRVAGVAERCSLAEIVDDALRIEATSLTNHHVEVVKQIERAPELSVDKHKALQILVNLVSNAKNAITATGRGAGSIVVRCRADVARAWVEVSDDGVGIPEENRTRIFEYGFTTSASGHGFGLHNSANAAAEMGGALRCASLGRGRGATFTLELPVA